MDDAAFERWSLALETLRLNRKNELEQTLQDKVDSFKPSEFYQMAQQSLETVMERWLAFEQEGPPVTSTKAMQGIRADMESIFDFELESLERDVTIITSRITWYPAELEDARKKFLVLADEIRKKYQIKLKTLSPGEIKSPLSVEPLRSVQYSGSAVRSGGGLSSVAMLLIGVLMGGGVSVYFRDSERKTEARFQEELQKMTADQHTLTDSMALLHSSFADLVTGKSQSIPQLQEQMARIQKILDDKIYIVNSDTADQREHLMKKIPAGQKLDRALDELEHERARRVKKIEDEYKPSLLVFEKRIMLYQDLLGQQPG